MDEVYNRIEGEDVLCCG